MESCNAVEKELGIFLAHSEVVNNRFNRNIDNHILFINSLKEQIEAVGDARPLSPDQIQFLQGGVGQVLDSVNRMTAEHRRLHKPLVTIGNSIDKNFSQLNGMNHGKIFSGDGAKVFNQVVVQHLYREGMVHVGDKLCEESGISVDPKYKKPFVELNNIVHALKQYNLEPAFKWVQANQDNLKVSSLEFRLHRLAFLQLVRNGSHPQTKAVAYCQKYFGKFSLRHGQEIQQLVGTLISISGVMAETRYAHFFDNTLWDDIHKSFFRDAIFAMQLPPEPPLAVCVEAGCKALPILHHATQILREEERVGAFGGIDMFPIIMELGLGSDFKFHSIFSCPILRKQETDTNPPMRLDCGHVISNEALRKLLDTTGKLTCPYCHKERDPYDVRKISF